MTVTATANMITWRRAIVLALLGSVLIAAVASDAVHARILEVLAAAKVLISHHSALGAAIFVALSAVSVMFAFASSSVLAPVAVVTWGGPSTILMLWGGWCIGGVLSYGAGRLLGRAVVRWLAAGKALHRLEVRLGPDTPFGLILLAQIALPSEIPGYVLGLVRYSFARYVLALALAELPYAIATSYISAGVVDRRGAWILIPGVAVVVTGVFALRALRTRLAAR